MDDLRTPIGLFFAIIGAILVVVSFTMTTHAELTDCNVNLWSGVAMLVFGSVMLWLARRAS